VKTLTNPGDLEEIRQRFTRIHPGLERRWGRMSAHQMICHLTDSMRGMMGEKNVSPVRVPVPKWLYKWVAFNMPMPWPKNIATRPEMDQFVGGTPPAELTADLQTLQATLVRFAGQPRNFQFQPHPMFGEMSEKEWMRWAYLHADHHLRQFGR
jgi:hypothetical protein